MAEREDIHELSGDFSDDSNDSLDLSISSSDSNGEDGLIGILPYQFEPVEVVRDEEPPQNQPPVAGNRRQHNDWCTCGHCATMLTETECCCCSEIAEVQATLVEYQRLSGELLECIVDHPGFQQVCLARYALLTAYKAYQQQYGNRAAHDENQLLRYTGYRQFVRWNWGFLGKEVRVVVPSCAVIRIRNEYPSDEYVGHHFAG